MRPEAALATMLMLAATLAGPVAAKEQAPKPSKQSPPISATGFDNVRLSQGYLASGDIELAEEKARAALASDGGSGLPHAAMALVYAEQKKDGKAQKEFDRALSLAPNDGAVLNAYGSWLCARGDREGADNAFRAAIEDRLTQPVQALANAGQCAMMGKEWSKADGYLRRAVAIAPRNRTILLMLSETQLELKRPMDARAFVQRADALGADARTIALAMRVEAAAGDANASGRYRKRLAEEFPNYVPRAEGARQQ
jgi:type IV pilus assembly protein PilF